MQIRNISLILFLFLSNISFSQDKLNIQPLFDTYYSEQEKNNNLDENINLILKGDFDEISKIVSRNGGLIKFRRIDLVSVRVPLSALKQLSESEKISPLRISVEKGRAMNDTMRMRNKVDSIHQAKFPLERSYTGKDVIIGVIDTGIDFTHPDFLNPDGSTRVLALWDHTKGFDATYTPAEYGYGQVWDSAQINAGLSTHHIAGTHHGSTVTGAAAGNGLASGDNMGVAPAADLVVVETNFVLPNWYATVVDAVEYIFSVADLHAKPCVINTSVGGYLGSHDGLDQETLLIEEMLNEKPGRLLVASAGNAGNKKFHVRGNVSNDTTFTWFQTYAPGNYAYVDIWADTADFDFVNFAIGADKVSPSYEFRGRTDFKNLLLDDMIDKVTSDAIIVNGKTLANIEYYVSKDNGRYEIEVYLPSPDSSQYNFRFITTGVGSYDLWGGNLNGASHLVSDPLPTVPEFNDIEFYIQPDSSQTIVTSWGCSSDAILVGNYINADRYTDIDGNEQINLIDLNKVGELKFHSSKGPTRNNVLKPDVATTGDVIFAAGSMSDRSILLSLDRPRLHQSGWHVSNGGTSMASPVVAGIGALLLERCPSLTSQKFKEIITSTAFQDAFTSTDLPNNSWGYGKTDAFAALVSTLFSPTISDLNLCEGEVVDYTSFEVFSKYEWHDGSSAPTYEIDSDMNGYLITENAFGCISDTSFFKAVVNPLPEIPEVVIDGGKLLGSEAISYQWYKDNDILVGETNKEINAIESGDYVLKAFNEFGCSTLSNPVEVNRIEGGITIFPNPSSDVFNIQINTGDIVNIQLVDVLGKIIIDKEKISDQFVINANQLKAATYFLIVDNDGVQTTSKISVVKD